MNKFGQELRKIRQEKNLSLKKLDEKTGISHSYISQIETGKRKLPTPDILKKLAKGLDMDYFDLMNLAGYFEAVADRQKFLKHKASGVLELLTENDQFPDTIEEDIKKTEKKFYDLFKADQELTPQFIRDMVENEELSNGDRKYELLNELTQIATKHSLGIEESFSKAFRGNYDLDPFKKMLTEANGIKAIGAVTEDDIKNRFNLSYLLEMDSDLYFDEHLLTDSQKMLIKRLIEAVILHDSESSS